MFKNQSFIFLFISSFIIGQEFQGEPISQENISDILGNLNNEISNPILSDQLRPDFDDESLINNQECIENGENCVIDENTSKGSVSQIFGFNYINTSPTSIDASSDLPVPNDYKVTFKDEIRVIMSGTKKSIFTLIVDLDGTILFPEIGSVQVVGDTYGELKNKLRNLIEIAYVGVNVDISLSSLSAKKISILGAVQRPGTYLVNPFTTLSNSLAYSGGLKQYASLRSVTLIRGDKKFDFDLYDFLLKGDRSKDINIEAGDTIVINSTNNFVSLSGEVKNAKVFEYKENETIQDIINFGSGLKSSANRQKIGLSIRSNKDFTIFSKEITLDQEYSAKNVVAVDVFALQLDSDFDVLVRGAVKEEGFYQFEDSKLTELIKTISFTKDVYPYMAVVQTPKDSKLFSIADTSTHNIDVPKNSIVKIFKSSDIKNSNNIFGDLNKESIDLINAYTLTIVNGPSILKVPIFGEYNTGTVFNFLNIDLQRLIAAQTTFTSPSSDVVSIGNYNDTNLVNSKNDSFNLRQKISELINVSVTGMVKFPGQYRLPKNATLEDLYKISGGLTETADKGIATFTRSSVRSVQVEALKRAKDQLNEFILLNMQRGQGVIDPSFISLINTEIDSQSLGRINGNFSINSEISKTFVLQDGDALFVPSKLETVSIFGEVLNPSTIIYQDNKSYKKYLEYAGGVKQFALKRDIYVIRANGLVTKRPSFLFIKGSIDIRPGDTIIVPRDLKVYENDVARVLLPISTVISNLAFGAASLEALRNN